MALANHSEDCDCAGCNPVHGACGNIAPDGEHRCVFGNGHAVRYHSHYPLEWWDGKWLKQSE